MPAMRHLNPGERIKQLEAEKAALVGLVRRCIDSANRLGDVYPDGRRWGNKHAEAWEATLGKVSAGAERLLAAERRCQDHDAAQVAWKAVMSHYDACPQCQAASMTDGEAVSQCAEGQRLDLELEAAGHAAKVANDAYKAVCEKEQCVDALDEFAEALAAYKAACKKEQAGG